MSAKAIGTALAEDESLVLLVSASQRQSAVLFEKVVRCYEMLGSPIAKVEDNATTLALANGSKVVSLPGSARTLVGYSSPRILVVDEAARVSDETYMSIAPMMAVSPRGQFIAMSTPLGRRGWFHEAFAGGGASWDRVTWKASQNPRIDPEWLREERMRLGQRWYDQDYECSFEENTGQVFSQDSLDAAFDCDVRPLFA